MIWRLPYFPPEIFCEENFTGDDLADCHSILRRDHVSARDRVRPVFQGAPGWHLVIAGQLSGMTVKVCGDAGRRFPVFLLTSRHPSFDKTVLHSRLTIAYCVRE